MRDSIWEAIPSDTIAEVLQSGSEWSRIRVGSRTGWMMSRFLVADDGNIPAEPELNDGAQTAEQGDGTDCSVSGRNNGPVPDVLLSEIYSTLRDLCEKIEQTIAMG